MLLGFENQLIFIFSSREKNEVQMKNRKQLED